MPTIKDIAREQNFHGTVSNVINGRGNVSVEKILLWSGRAACNSKVNAKAQSLRLEKGPQSRLCFRGSSSTISGYV